MTAHIESASRHRGLERIASNLSRMHCSSSYEFHDICTPGRDTVIETTYTSFCGLPHAFHDPGAPGTRARVGKRQTEGAEVVVDERIEVSVRVILPLIEATHLFSSVMNQKANHAGGGPGLKIE